MDRLEDTKALLAGLVAQPSVSTDSNLGVIGLLAQRLEDAGARVEVLGDGSGTKANLWATIGPDAPGGIVLSGHTDVVPVDGQDWQRDPWLMAEEDGRLYGRGTCDMKGFVAAATAMAPVFAAAGGARPVHFAFTHDEEVGCLGGQALAAELKRRGAAPKVAIVGEPTSMRVMEGHKGCCEYTTRFGGLAGHGSGPDRGVNAVEYAVRYVARLLELAQELKARAPEGSRFDPPWTTVNTGSLNGGFMHNVIPEEAVVEWEFRPVNDADFRFVKEAAQAEADKLLPLMRAVHPGASITTEVMGEVRGLIPADLNEARDIIFELTGANGADVVPFGTEAGLFQEIGMDVVVCGPGSIEQAHKPDEWLAVEQLSQCLTMLEGLAGRV